MVGRKTAAEGGEDPECVRLTQTAVITLEG